MVLRCFPGLSVLHSTFNEFPQSANRRDTERNNTGVAPVLTDLWPQRVADVKHTVTRAVGAGRASWQPRGSGGGTGDSFLNEVL